MWQIIVGIYDGDPRSTNDHKSSWRVGKAWKWLGRFVHRSQVSEYAFRARGSSSVEDMAVLVVVFVWAVVMLF